MGQHNKPRCTSLDPDCDNCPFPDCVATTRDIMRQLIFHDKAELEARNAEIYRLYTEEGMSQGDIGKKFELTKQHVQRIISKRRRSCLQLS